MSTTLDPRIAAKLDAFAHRRRRLIIFRGVCAAVAMLLAAMMAVALIDWFFVLPDWLRWSLSGAAYVAVLVVAWRVCGRLLLQVPDSRRLARFIEGAEPSLREELLSAVELGQGSGEWDSPQFRALVQAEVSERIAGVEVERLLPAVLLRTAVGALAVMLVLCFIALVVPSLRFGALLVRALVPGANLDRVSSVQVKIIQPAPASMAVPQGDSVPLLVELSGRRVTTAFLETFTKSGGRAVVQLQPAPGGRFSAGIQVAREDVEYRVRAFDAITKKYTLHAAARPSVVSFHKAYRYPAYTGLAAKTVDEETGDLVAVEGTEVELAVQTNQPVKLAVLSVEVGHKTQEIPLTAAADGRLTATLPLKASGVYRVELVSAATGFENKFNPEYELRVTPDLIPQVTLETPERDLIASSNEVIGLTATATDDISLVKVEQHIRVNDGKWTVRGLSQATGPEVKINDRWDLFQQGVHPGDTITTKLVATDCKGNRGESRPVAITIAAAGFDRARLDALAAEHELLKAVNAWEKSTEALEKKHGEVRQLVERNPAEDADKRRAAYAGLATAIDECAGAAAAAQAQLVTTIRLATPGHETANLVLLSRIISHGEAAIGFLPRQTQAAGADPFPEYARGLSRLAAESCQWIVRRGKQAGDNLEKLVSAEEFDIINENLLVIAREQNRLATLAQNSGEDAAKWQPVAGRMKVVLAEIASTEEAMKVAAATNRTGARDRLERLRMKLTDQRRAATAALAAPVPGRELLAPALNLAKAATETAQAMLEMKREHDQHALNAVQELTQQAEPSWLGFEKLRQEVEDAIRPEKWPAEVRGSLAAGRWDARAGIWKAYGDAEELRPDADAPFVKDVRSLRLALDGLREDLVTPGPIPKREPFWKKVAALDQAYRMLEAAHDLTQLANGYDLLATSERYQTGGLHARTSDVTDFLRLWQRLRAADNDLQRTNPSNPEVRKLMQEAARLLNRIPSDQAARSLEEEMRQRMKADREPALMTAPAERVAGLVREALAVLQPAIDQARQVLNAATPKLAERMAQLAKEAEKMREDNAEKAEDKAEKAPEQAKAEAKQNLAQQQKLNEKVDTLKDAIRAEANLQNVLEKEGREKARDADDALAMLREPPARAEQDLQEAAQAERASEQKAAMKAAAQEDQKLAKALDQLAQHYEAMEKGDAEKTRLALREEEKKLGVKEDLDQQYAKAEDLAKTAEQSPQGMLEKLEKALPHNPLMRQELSGVSRDLLQKANQQLASAAKDESAVAREVEKMAAAQAPPTPPAQAPPADGAKPPMPMPTPDEQLPANAPKQADASKPEAPPQANANSPADANKPGDARKPPQSQDPALAKAAEQQQPIAKNAQEAGQAVERAGRHEERLKNGMAGQQLQKLGADVQQVAKNDVPKAQAALTKADAAAQAKEAVSAAEQELKKQSSLLAATQAGQPLAAPDGADSPATAKPDGEANPGGEAKPAGAMKPGAAAGPGSEAKPAAAAKPAGAGKPGEAGQPASPAPPAKGTSGEAPESPAGGEDPLAQVASNTPAPAPQQVWMARALDSLDAALHEAPPNSQQAKEGGKGQQQGQPQGQGQPSPDAKAASEAAQQAQKAMAAAGQAAAAEMRANRSPTPPGQPSADTAKGGQMAVSKTGAKADGTGTAYGQLPRTAATAQGNWGKLPKQMAEQLSQGQREAVSAEYQKEVETYYRVIAERARKEAK